MKWTIDRFEGAYAVAETPDGGTAQVAKALLPPGAKEGDVIAVSLDARETRKRAKRIARLAGKLFR